MLTMKQFFSLLKDSELSQAPIQHVVVQQEKQHQSQQDEKQRSA